MYRYQVSRFFLVLAMVGLVSSSYACTMSVTPSIETEWEIEIQYEDYDSVDDIAYYKVEIESSVVPPIATAQCQCGLGLGSQGGGIPSTFNVYGAAVAFRAAESEDDFDIEAFAGFSEDEAVGTEVANLTNGAAGFGFSTLVNPFVPPNAGPEDRIVLSFLIGFDPDEFDEVNGSTMQFAAGSTEPGHALAVFSGYQTSLALPPITIRGDFNNDSKVDGADYTIWRDTLGSTTNLQADVDESGTVDESDYEEWERNYGINVFNGSVGNVQLPEPGTMMMLIVANCLLTLRARQ